MKLNPDFIARDIAGELVIVPIGSSADPDMGLISTNEVGKLIWHQLEKQAQPDEIVAAVLDEFDVDETTARQDTAQFLAKLKELGAIQE